MTEQEFKKLNINSYVYKHMSYTDEIKIYQYKGISKSSFAIIIIQDISGFDAYAIKTIKDFINEFFLSEKECKINFIKEEYKLFIERINSHSTAIEKYKEYLNRETREFEGLKNKYKDFMKENAEYFI